MPPRVVEIRKGVLDKNDRLAAGLRARYAAAGVCTVNLVSSPGTGKTALLEAVLRRLVERGQKPAALVGDCATENDAVRLARSGAPVRQIVTHGICHLEANMVETHLEGWELSDFEFLFVENVGNLVCPSSYDLGEDLRIVLLSVTEGEDKPLKYPEIFGTADLAVVTKIDLAEPCDWDRAAAYASIEAVNPGLRIVETSSKKGTGLDELCDVLTATRDAALAERAGVPQ